MRRVPDRLTIKPFQNKNSRRAGTADHIPDNGKAQRFIQTHLREWAYAQAYNTSNQRAAELPLWLHRYNWHCPSGKAPSGNIAALSKSRADHHVGELRLSSGQAGDLTCAEPLIEN